MTDFLGTPFPASTITGNSKSIRDMMAMRLSETRSVDSSEAVNHTQAEDFLELPVVPVIVTGS